MPSEPRSDFGRARVTLTIRHCRDLERRARVIGAPTPPDETAPSALTALTPVPH